MGEYALDLFQIRIWCALGASVVVLTPLTVAAVRKWAWACANLAFLWLLFGNLVLGSVVAGVLVVYAVLRLIDERRFGFVSLALACAGVSGLFLIHKLPTLSQSLGIDSLNPILSAVGFSYLALRLVEVIRAVAQKEQPILDLPSTVNYLMPFHMLAAGPIQAYADFVAQPVVPSELRISDALVGVERIALGLFKKFVVAGVIEKVFLTGFRAPFPYLLAETQFFYLWVYLDFSAYSDIAVGAGRLLGVATPENFNRPYLARNMIDYWDRWHMTLSQFIRRNLFVPIQLDLMRRTSGRAGLLCATVAFTVSFIACGLWHAIGVRWLIWGALQAIGLIVANCYREVLTRKLGRAGLKRYAARPGIRVAATVLTQQFVALTLVVVQYPWE
jgi:D-alanyl-lipoteichoic acid acyltransferase DltB (MBOAT superfamily)